DAVAQADRVRESEQQLQGVSRDAVLRVIEVDPGGLRGHAFATLRIVCKERSEMHIPDLSMMRFKGSTSRAFGECRHGVDPPIDEFRATTRLPLSDSCEVCALG